MKCDELKVHKAYNRWIDEEMPTPNDDLICNEVYLKSEADKVIAELKKKLKEQTSIAEEGWKEFRTYHTSYAEAVKELYDKNKEIAELKADYKEACDRLQTANLIKDEQLAATRHSKYKRCLNKAEWCEERSALYDLLQERTGFDWSREIGFYFKWQQRWLMIAEQFKDKEAK